MDVTKCFLVVVISVVGFPAHCVTGVTIVENATPTSIEFICSVQDASSSTNLARISNEQEWMSSVFKKSVCLGCSVTLTCCILGVHIWEFNGEVIFAASFNPKDIGFSNVYGVKVNDTLSFLHIDNTTWKNAGNYSCASFGKKGKLKYFVTVHDMSLHISINGRSISEMGYLLSGVRYNITCDVSGNKIEREHVLSLKTISSINWNHFIYQIHDATIGHYNTSMNKVFSRNTLQSLFICEGTDQNDGKFDKEKATLEIFVLPDLIIQSQDRNLSEIYEAYTGETLILKCVAFGSRPPVDLRWMNGTVDNMTLTTTITKQNWFDKSTIDSEITLKIEVKKNIELKCSSSGRSDSHELDVALMIKVKGWWKLFYVIVAGGSTAAVMMIICVIGTGFCFYRKERGKSKAFSAPYRQHEKPASNRDPSEGQAKFDKLSENFTMITAQTTPSAVTSNEYVTSSDNVTLISRVHCGDVIDYWRGNLPLDGSHFDCVCETVSENAQRKNRRSFLSLAKSLRCIPDHPNIVSFLGAVIDRVPYYIYREFVANGTLRDYLLYNYRSHRPSENSGGKNWKVDKRHLIMFAQNVVDAMDFLEFHQFNHPALRASKVLLSNTLACKLFDFWPRDLSSDRTLNLVKGPNPPIAWLPPETIFTNLYDTFSDVWSYGVLLWEIFSLGEVPFQLKSQEEIEADIRKMKLLSQPHTCPDSVFRLMLSMWDKFSENRPSFSELKDRVHSLHTLFKTESQNEDQMNCGYLTVVSDIQGYYDTHL